jgi:adenosylhomocysteine nucleosidase
MQEEADLIIKKYNLNEEKSDSIPNWIKIFKWEKQNYDEDCIDEIILVLSWIWKIQATLATTYLLENYEINKIINIWIAGNLDNWDVKIWDVFIPNTFIQHDIYLPFEWEHLDYAKKPIFLDYAIWENYDLKKFGLILSGVCLTWDQFIDNKEITQELREKYSADIVEMEAFAILSVARAYWVLDKCVVIKAVSDWADSEAKDAHMNNLEFAMENSISVLELVI